MTMMAMAAVCYNNRALYYYRTFNNNRTLNNYWSFYDYRSVVMMMSYVNRFNNHWVVMMSAVMMMTVVNCFNTMMRTVVMTMMLCRN
jgi:hypothetical protein